MRPRFGFAKFYLRNGYSCHTGTVSQRLLRHVSPLPRFPKRQHANISLTITLTEPMCGGTGYWFSHSVVPIIPQES